MHTVRPSEGKALQPPRAHYANHGDTHPVVSLLAFMTASQILYVKNACAPSNIPGGTSLIVELIPLSGSEPGSGQETDEIN